ncbi:MAG: aminotransferase class V-fold PLP-dependent enzyme [Odoribacter sp.]
MPMKKPGRLYVSLFRLHQKKKLFLPGVQRKVLIWLLLLLGEAFIREGDEYLVTEMEHHANIVPWQVLCEW